jgi:hypothetical protein
VVHYTAAETKMHRLGEVEYDACTLTNSALSRYYPCKKKKKSKLLIWGDKTDRKPLNTTRASLFNIGHLCQASGRYTERIWVERNFKLF